MTADCVFCRIIRNELPSNRIYEDDLCLAFLDIAPIIKGHSLVIPKEHFDPVTNVPESLLQHLIITAQRVAQAQMTGLKADGINLMQANGAAAGQVVPHVHFHVIPRYQNDGHHWNWQTTSYTQPDEAFSMAEKIRKSLI